MVILKYNTDDERQALIDEKIIQGFTLVEVMNVIEGNFLGFVPTDQVPAVSPDLIRFRELEVESTSNKTILSQIMLALVANDLI